MDIKTYFMLNLAIALSFYLSRFTLSLPIVRKEFLQQQRLKFTRRIFILTLLFFFMVPIISTTLHLNQHNHFHLQPFFQRASASVFSPHFNTQAQTLRFQQNASIPAISSFLMIFIATGFCFYLIKYIKNMLVLRKLTHNASYKRKINNTHVLMIGSIEVPFCWSLMNQHYVVLPTIMSEKYTDYRLAIRHELQHIRQHDTKWSHLLLLLQACCFWNPWMKAWINWFDELQEFACDEALIQREHSKAIEYAQCLVNVAKNSLNSNEVPAFVLGIFGLASSRHVSTLERRITMLFHYDKHPRHKIKKWLITTAYIFSSLTTITTAYALSNTSAPNNLNAAQITTLINQSDNNNVLQVSATSEVVAEINNIRTSAQAKQYMQNALFNMKHYAPLIQPALKNSGIPNDLMVIPLVESGYRPLDASKNPVQAAGIWQFIPATARKYGLVINSERDDRYNTELSTKAAVNYLNNAHAEFNDWGMAAIAYEIGEQQTAALIQKTGSKDPWVIARSPLAPKELANFVAMLDASVIIMHNPTLVS